MTGKRKSAGPQLSLLAPVKLGRTPKKAPSRSLRVAGFFAGIGGIEQGFHLAGHETVALVESMQEARAVLGARFKGVPLLDDVRHVTAADLPGTLDVITAGFPCQDLSSVGLKEGIHGSQSSLVGEVLRILEEKSVPWLVLENVPFLLDLAKGKALQLVTEALQSLGYRWAYRVLDAEAFGVPQRRRRWFLVASNVHDPRGVLLAENCTRPAPPHHTNVACGFYWTEGMRALGWAVDAVPPIKGGSTIGVPSPPAIVLPNRGGVICPDLRDCERLQGFPANWTLPAEEVAKAGFRWRLVGNAVCVPVARWVAEQLAAPPEYDPTFDVPIRPGSKWPDAAWSMGDGRVFQADVGDHPIWLGHKPLHEFLSFPGRPLSSKAAAGFLNRVNKGSLRFADGFLDQIRTIASAHGVGAV